MIGEQGGRVAYTVHQKATSQHVPLSEDSGHPTHCHYSWPQAQTGRFRILTSSKSLRAGAVAHFRSWLGGRCPSHPYFRPRRPLRRGTEAARPSWIVLPHHPVWEKAIQRMGRLSLVRTPFQQLGPRAAWTLANPHLVHSLRNQKLRRNGR